MNSPVAETDKHDIRAALDGDENAYARLVERYQGDVFAQMWRFSRDRNTVDELVQEVFVEVYFSLGKFKGRAPFLHWVRRIATRVGYHYWKRKARDKKVQEAALEQHRDARPVSEISTPSEAGQYLFELLEALPPKERMVLTLYYFEELSTKEIAGRLNWSHSLVRVRMHRARRRLRGLLENAGFGRDSHDGSS